MRILVILLTLILAFLLPEAIYAHSQTQVIEMTSGGFEPQTVTVDQNSSIIFLNKDSKDRWPASNIHPTHQLYPKFDPKKPIAPGESWPFKPQNPGQWKYHDHLLPHMRGVLIVTEENGSGSNTLRASETSREVTIKTVIENIKNTFGQLYNKFKNLLNLGKKMNLPQGQDFIKLTQDKQQDTLKQISDNLGSPKAWEFIKETFKGAAGSSGNIHDLAHLSGSLIFEQNNFEGIRLCSPNFAFGCYHGFLDKAFERSLDQLLEAQAACLKLGPENLSKLEVSTINGPAASCIHGIGHGVASFYGSNDLKKSLSSCRKLTSGKEYCFDGVFMEFVRSAPDSTFKKDDPLYPCNALEKDFGPAYSSACGRNQPSLLMGRFKMGFDDVVQVCKVAKSAPFKESCFEALGFSLAATTDTQKIIEGCRSMGEIKFIASCIKAAAGELVFQETPGWEENSLAVCNGTLEGRDECLAHIKRLIKEYSRQRKVSFLPRKRAEDLNLYLRRVLKVCYDNQGRDGCYKQAADILYREFGLKQNLELLNQNENYPEVYARCHEVTHYLSRSEYHRSGSIAGVYAQCDSTCHGGCYHGTLEAYLKEKEGQPGFVLNKEFANVCGKSADYQKPLEFNECLHGMGHAAMFIKEMELKESLELCDTISSQEYKERCFTGVFMENSSSSTSFDHASKYIKTDDPFYPCNALEEKYQPVCWQYQSSYFSIITHQDWVKVANLCLQIPLPYQDKCFRSVGTNQVGFTQSLQTMKDDCDLMPSDHFRDVCVGGVVSSLSYRFVGDEQKMIDFCSIVDPINQETCFKQMGMGLADWDSNKNLAAEKCRKIPDQDGFSWCLSVI